MKNRWVHGNYGEKLIREYWAVAGWKHVGAIKDGNICPEGSHDFDHLFYKGDLENPDAYFFADSKAKARRSLKNDTGINLQHFAKYLKIHKAEMSESKYKGFYLFFVDEHPSEERIYSISLARLLKTGLKNLYSMGLVRQERDKDGIRLIQYFDLSLARTMRKLEPEEVNKLKELGERTWEY